MRHTYASYFSRNMLKKLILRKLYSVLSVHHRNICSTSEAERTCSPPCLQRPAHNLTTDRFHAQTKRTLLMSLQGFQCLLSVTVADSVHIQQMTFIHTITSYCSWNKTSDTLYQLIARYNLPLICKVHSYVRGVSGKQIQRS